MPDKPAFCHGCLQPFSLSGYAFHLRQTTNPSCRQIYDMHMTQIPESDPPEPVASSDQFDPHDVLPHLSSPVSQGFFREEGANDEFLESSVVDEQFPENMAMDAPELEEWTGYHDNGGQGHDDGEGNGDDDGDDNGDDGDDGDEDDDNGDEDEDAAEQYQLEHQWEPDLDDPLLLVHDRLPRFAGQSDTELSEPLADTAAMSPPPNARPIFECALREEHTTIEPFPGNTAGSEVHELHKEHAYEYYEAKIGNRSNPYAPFASKLDWEFAHWAKIHGPGSNAITELLKIEGVSAHLAEDVTKVLIK
jgi:uncharacterized sporulation protein YeaH/YhbH (DUF444 family)